MDGRFYFKVLKMIEERIWILIENEDSFEEFTKEDIEEQLNCIEVYKLIHSLWIILYTTNLELSKLDVDYLVKLVYRFFLSKH